MHKNKEIEHFQRFGLNWNTLDRRRKEPFAHRKMRVERHEKRDRLAATTSSLTATNYASKGGPEPKLNILDMDFTPKL
jgi:hypothetical protein